MTQAHQQLVHVCVCLTLTVPRVGYKDVSREGPQAKREREGEREEGGEERGEEERRRGRGGREGEKREGEGGGEESIMEQYHNPTLAVLTDLEAILSCLDAACPFLLTVYIHAKWRDSTEVSTVDKKLKTRQCR